MWPIPETVKRLLWDVSPKELGPEHSGFIIERILENGDQDGCIWMIKQFTTEEIQRVVLESRRLSRKSAGFWSLYFGLPASSVRSLSEEEWPCSLNP